MEMHKPETTAADRSAASYPEPYTVPEVAKKLRVDPRLLYREIEAGRLEAVRIGRLIRITNEQLDSYLGRKTK